MMVGPVETGVPLPPTERRRQKRNPVARALAGLAIGQSRVFAAADVSMVQLSKLAYRTLGKGNYRTAPAELPGSIRVWRIR